MILARIVVQKLFRCILKLLCLIEIQDCKINSNNWHLSEAIFTWCILWVTHYASERSVRILKNAKKSKCYSRLSEKKVQVNILHSWNHQFGSSLSYWSLVLPLSLPFSVSVLQDIFVSLSQVDGVYFVCNIDDFKFLADMIQHIPLNLRSRYVFCTAPINKKQPFVCTSFLKVSISKRGKMKHFTCNHQSDSQNYLDQFIRNWLTDSGLQVQVEVGVFFIGAHFITSGLQHTNKTRLLQHQKIVLNN